MFESFPAQKRPPLAPGNAVLVPRYTHIHESTSSRRHRGVLPASHPGAVTSIAPCTPPASRKCLPFLPPRPRRLRHRGRRAERRGIMPAASCSEKREPPPGKPAAFISRNRPPERHPPARRLKRCSTARTCVRGRLPGVSQTRNGLRFFPLNHRASVCQVSGWETSLVRHEPETRDTSNPCRNGRRPPMR